MNPTDKQVRAWITAHSNNDFAPVIYTVIDYRETHTVTTVVPLRRDSEIAYYENHGYTCLARENRGDFFKEIERVVELTRKEAKVCTFRSWGAAAAFVRSNYAALSDARSTFWG